MILNLRRNNLYLENKTFENIVRNSPVCAVDICILNDNNKLLLGKRKNPPAKDFFFVPGGRIRKGETLFLATNRILNTELNYEISKNIFSKIKLLGIFEHFYDDNFIGNNSFPSHYLIVAYLVSLSLLKKKYSVDFQDQHEEYIWYNLSSENDIKIHPYIKDYLRNIKS